MTDDTTTEMMLAALASTPPENLYRDTVLAVGAADSVTTTDSPIGPVWLAWNVRGVTALSPLFATATIEEFASLHRRESHETTRLPSDLEDVVTDALATLDAREVPIDMTGIAPFQQSVLATCATIPVGQVRPYGWIADQIHNPGSVRAVGTALGRNPIPLLIPCHRVVKSDGSVGQYAFGPEVKHELLIREGAILT